MCRLERFVEHYERAPQEAPEGAEPPWTLDRPDPKWLERLTEAIVAFRIPIEQLTGKWKLSQNHPTARRQRVADALRAQDDADAQAVGRLMQESLDEGSERSDAP